MENENITVKFFLVQSKNTHDIKKIVNYQDR